jgi:hypothetical protein
MKENLRNLSTTQTEQKVIIGTRSGVSCIKAEQLQIVSAREADRTKTSRGPLFLATNPEQNLWTTIEKGGP